MEMEIREVDIEKLEPAPYNPREISGEALDGLAHSIGEFGLVEPIVWNERTGHVVGGHQRLKVLEQTGAKSTKVVVVDLDPEREKALNVALNSRHIQGDWTQGLGAILQELKVELPELSAALRLDILETDFQKLFPPEGYAGLVDPDAIPEEPERTVSRPGDLWQLGRHRLLCGDSTKPETLKKLMDGAKAVLVATDPPYGVAYDGNQHRRKVSPTKHGGGIVYRPILNDDLEGQKLLEFLTAAFQAAAQVSTADASWYVWHASVTRDIFIEALRSVGVEVHQEIVWVKENFQFGRADYHWRHEPCLYGWGAKHRFVGMRNQSTVWEVTRETDHKHPTQKPVELFARAMRNNALSLERKSEIVTKLEGLFSLALMAYKDAQRQNKDGSRVPDPYAQGILLQRAVEILERLAELSGFISRKGFVVTQTQVQTQGQGQTMDPELRRRVFYEMVNEHRLERGLAPLPPFESRVPGQRS